jgi:hypothetical protein
LDLKEELEDKSAGKPEGLISPTPLYPPKIDPELMIQLQKRQRDLLCLAEKMEVYFRI